MRPVPKLHVEDDFDFIVLVAVAGTVAQLTHVLQPSRISSRPMCVSDISSLLSVAPKDFVADRFLILVFWSGAHTVYLWSSRVQPHDHVFEFATFPTVSDTFFRNHGDQKNNMLYSCEKLYNFCTRSHTLWILFRDGKRKQRCSSLPTFCSARSVATSPRRLLFKLFEQLVNTLAHTRNCTWVLFFEMVQSCVAQLLLAMDRTSSAKSLGRSCVCPSCSISCQPMTATMTGRSLLFNCLML